MMNLIRKCKQTYGLQNREQDVLSWFRGYLGLTLTEVCTRSIESLSELQIEDLKKGCVELGRGVPVAYLLKDSEWNGRMWSVNTDVLIPRPETITLLQASLALSFSRADVLELGTGSGILAVSIARARPNWSVTATDKSRGALEVAKKNARGVHVNWLNHDWDAEWKFELFDTILSNPPYLADDDAHLDALKFEPHAALVAGPTGLECFYRIAGQALTCLKPGGRIIFEHGNGQAQAVRKILIDLGYGGIIHHKDALGWVRVTEGVWGSG
jgi:release factor glutamine methyltransferase